jgi:uncharacterized protein (TIGR03435 family)
MGDRDPGRVDWSNVSLRDIIRVAYALKDYQISGPDWLNAERYDVLAKVPEGVPASQKPAMLQALLAERFKMAVHWEKKELAAYALSVAKGGPKMKEFVEAPADSGPAEAKGDFGGVVKRSLDGFPKLPPGKAGMMMSFGRLSAQGTQMKDLADGISRQLDRPVVDETGLTGKYDFQLQWTPGPGEGGIAGMKVAMARQAGRTDVELPNEDGPSLPVALQQQLGLKLEQKKLPVDLLVIDRAEKVPVEN